MKKYDILTSLQQDTNFEYKNLLYKDFELTMSSLNYFIQKRFGKRNPNLT